MSRCKMQNRNSRANLRRDHRGSALKGLRRRIQQVTCKCAETGPKRYSYYSGCRRGDWHSRRGDWHSRRGRRNWTSCENAFLELLTDSKHVLSTKPRVLLTYHLDGGGFQSHAEGLVAVCCVYQSLSNCVVAREFGGGNGVAEHNPDIGPSCVHLRR